MRTLPSCVLRAPDQEPVRLYPGAFIGRSEAATLPLNDPRVSEMHAYVSLRGGELLLIALRGRIAVDGQIRGEVSLSPGVVVGFARDLDLTVDEVVLPESMLVVEGDGLPRQVPTGPCSLVLAPEPSLVPGVKPDAHWVLWPAIGGWHLRQDGSTVVVDTDRVVHTGSRTFHLRFEDLVQVGAHHTEHAGSLHTPLVVHARYDTVHVRRSGHPVVVLSGRGARMVSELVEFDGPAPWQVLAQEVWGTESNVDRLRARFDVTLGRVRTKLTSAGIRADLIRPDGCGNLELVLEPQDRVISEL